jgi:predicted HTH transcriptional regulator
MLIHYNALFSFLDYESTLLKYKADYFKLTRRVREGENNEKFFLFLLKVLNESVEGHLRKQRGSQSTETRISLFKQSVEEEPFSRQDYLRKFKFISAITASRDLRFAVESGQFIKKGDKRLARYWIAEKRS